MIRKVYKVLGITFLILLGLILFLIVISVRPVDKRPFQETEYYQKTKTTLNQTLDPLGITSESELMVGAGKAGLTPLIGVPLAGYGARNGAPSEGVHDSLFVRVIAVQSGSQRAYLVGYDALLLYPHIARQLEKRLETELNIHPEHILYTATHTHSGPGGWGEGWVEEQFAGPPDSHVVPMFVDSTLAAFRRAVDFLRQASVTSGSVQAPRFIRNRLVGEKGDVDAELVYLAFHHDNQLIALFTTYSAHATVLSARNMMFSGDYPGYLQRKLESEFGGIVLFAAAGLGSHSYRGEGEGFDKARFIGEGLADSLMVYLSSRDNHETAKLMVSQIPFYTARKQVRLTQNLTLAPWLANLLITPHDVYVQIIAVDEFMIIGSPGEFSGELALKVKQFADTLGVNVTVTSFNGCYIGYLTPSKYYEMDEYETRLMSWFGPYTGDYLTEIMKHGISRLFSQ